MHVLSRDDLNLQAANSADFDAARWIEVERLRLVYSNLPVTLMVSMACAGILAALLGQVISWMRLLAWVSAGVLISCLRYRRYRQFRQLPNEALDSGLWSRRASVGTGLAGMCWGSSALVLFPGDLPHQVAIAFVLAGLCAGAMTSYAALPRCYVMFVLPALLPIAFRMALQGTAIHNWMALLILLFLGGVVRVSLETARMIGNVLKVRVENLQLTEALRHQATHDALVDLPNHREFNTRLLSVAQSCAQRREPFALLFIDLDRFKEINDKGGHAAGDEALRRIGHLLKTHLRPNDTAARLGGDEFAVLLPGCPRQHAERIAGQILEAIDQFVLHWERGQTFRVGASIGLAYSETGQHDAAALLRAADAACYAAKTGGRGRIETYEASPDYEPSGRFEISTLRNHLS
jgi:diguanylate cyclase (GGDEF)-like protein